MLGKDRMLHLLPVSRPTILVMKSVIFAGYMYVYFIIQLTRYLAIVPPEITSSKFQLSTIYALSKLLSIVVFFTLILALMLTLKNIENKVIAALAFAMLLITVIAIQGVALYQYLSNFRPTDWIIGIVEDMKGMNQYINIIPINFVPKDGSASFVEQTFSIMSVVLNLIVLSISSTLFFVQAKFRKYNYLEY